jgi:hypothetical protein
LPRWPRLGRPELAEVKCPGDGRAGLMAMANRSPVPTPFRQESECRLPFESDPGRPEKRNDTVFRPRGLSGSSHRRPALAAYESRRQNRVWTPPPRARGGGQPAGGIARRRAEEGVASQNTGAQPPTPSATPMDLYAFGNRQQPRAPRPSDFGVNGPNELVGPESPPTPHGASTIGDPHQAPLTGHYHCLPAGTPLPDGLER